jgi:pimeloyl-ACP methyl ester carboxylesterase
MLLSHGTQSPPMFPAVIAQLVTLVPAAQVLVLDGAGHDPQVSHPAALAASLTAFYEQLTALDGNPVR